MKQALVLFAILAVLPFAQAAKGNQSEAAMTDWQCSVTATTSENTKEEVLGAKQPTKAEAKEDALFICNTMYKKCKIKKCSAHKSNE